MMQLIDYLNSAACLILMGFSLPVAMIIGNSGLWLERMSLVAVQIGLFMRLVNPWVGWAPPITWAEAWLSISAALMLCIWWRRVWYFVRSHLGPMDHRRRRRTDWPLDAGPPPPPPAAHVLRHHWHQTPKA